MNKHSLVLVLLLATFILGFVRFNIPTVKASEPLIDSYSISNQSGDSCIQAVHPSADAMVSARSQSFQPNQYSNITKVKFYLKKNNLPSGSYVAELYAANASTVHGVDCTPTGSALATSEYKTMDSLSASYALTTLNFNSSHQYMVEPSTTYCISIKTSSATQLDDTHYFQVGNDITAPTHDGNQAMYRWSQWQNLSSGDLCFYLYGTYFYSCTLKGLYDESTGLLEGASERAVNVTAYHIDETSETFEVNGTYQYNTTFMPLYFHFDLGSEDREYWLSQGEVITDIYLFSQTLTTYTISFLDLAGVLDDNPIVEAQRLINGTLMTVEKRKVDVEKKVQFSLVQGCKYTISIQDGASYTFGELLMTSQTTIQLTLKGIAFPKETLMTSKYVRIYGTRTFGAEVQEQTFYSTSNDGYLTKDYLTYATGQAADDADSATAGADQIFIGQTPLDPYFSTWAVGTSTDDCLRVLTDDQFFTDNVVVAAGDDDASNYDMSSGMRFTTVFIPDDAVITSAYLKLRAYHNESLPQTIIEGEDADDAATFSTSANYDGRDRTTASVFWTPTEWTTGVWYTSPDIKTIIQEIIDRPGWSLSNDLVVFWSFVGVGHNAFKALWADSYDAMADYEPELKVYWNEPGSIYRSYLYFDTSTIPDDEAIQSATLSLYGKTDESDADFNLCIQHNATHPETPLVIGDYDKDHYDGSCGGKLSTSGFTTSGYNTITLNSTGLAWISKTGITTFCLRSSEDISASAPAGDEYVTVYANEKGEGYKPKLVVTFGGYGSITIVYQDLLNMTGFVKIEINYKNGTNVYTDTETSDSFNHVWSSALNDMDYAVVCTIDHQRYGVYTWKNYYPQHLSDMPWSLDWFGKLPFNTAYIIPAFLILFAGGCFSQVNAYVGAFAMVVTACIIAYMGWLPIAGSTLMVAFALMILMGVVAAKRRVAT